ncbi:MAG: hypothetical protein FJ029_14935 [Actinobacteria bacterium]|nr:hypothetical protein [Actinomycetota bacterium]
MDQIAYTKAGGNYGGLSGANSPSWGDMGAASRRGVFGNDFGGMGPGSVGQGWGYTPTGGGMGGGIISAERARELGGGEPWRGGGQGWNPVGAAKLSENPMRDTSGMFDREQMARLAAGY